MDELVAFMNARLDEEEAAAKVAANVAGPDWVNDTDYHGDGSHYVRSPDGAILADTLYYGDEEMAPFVARHDPARVLREVAAKRAHIRAWEAVAVNFRTVGETEREFGAREALEGVLEADVAVYSDHPDYREEWKP